MASPDPDSLQTINHPSSPVNSNSLSAPQNGILTSTGPQQTRKPAPPANDGAPSQRLTFDPKSLLNPKGASKNADTPGDGSSTDAAVEADGSEGNTGFGQMIENLHGVIEREDVSAKKRKARTIEDGESDEERKKQKASSLRSSGGGTISAHMKEQSAKIAASAQSSQTIDLTNDDDEVQLVKDASSKGGTEEVVCLGILHGKANASRIPAYPPNKQRVIKDYWPPMKVKFQRASIDPRSMLIHLFDNHQDKFATLDSKLASALCPMLSASDVNGIRLKIFLKQRAKKEGEYMGKPVSESMGLQIELSSPRNKADAIGRFLSQKQLFLTAAPNRERYDPQAPQNFGPSKSTQNKGQSTTYTVQRTQEEMRREQDALFDELSKAGENLPSMEANSNIITSQLFDHQKQALHFLMDHERDDFEGDDLPAHSLWEYRAKDNGQRSWYHKITYEESAQKPDYVRGGILADVMGLGKTLSILALIAHTVDDAFRFHREDPPPSADVMRNARATLIICPKSVMSNWAAQIEQHTAADKMQVYQYHGANRMQDFNKLARHHVVLTTYNTCAAEFSDGMRKRTALNSVNWFRIILDEAHTIRTTDTKMFKACCALDAQRRWAVTGTPVQNSLNDLGSLVKFLRLHPFDNHAKWTQHIMSPFKLGDADVIPKLQILVRSITLCRGKETIGLPDRTETSVKLQFSKAEALLYRQFASAGRSQFNNITHGGTTALKGKAYAHVLKSIGRLRQICAHGREMITDEDLKDVEGDDPENAIVLDAGDEPELEPEDEFVSEKQAYETFTTMQDSDVDRCQACDRKLDAERTLPNGATDLTGQDSSDSDDDSGSEEEDGDEKDGADLVGHLTPCYHLLCPDCSKEYVNEISKITTADRHYHCPHCDLYVRFGLFALRRSALRQFVAAREAAKKTGTAKWDEATYSGPHTKVKALLDDLAESARETSELPPGEPPVRSVVFSGWTSYLDLIGYALTKNGIRFTRIDGAMSVKKRTQAIETFNTDPDVTVLIVSIKAGGQGLNFTAANKAYVMEPQYNPGVEQQAVDRIHRIGQNREVTIKHFIMQDSIEEAIVKLQKRKQKLAQLSMSNRRSKAEEAKERMIEIQALFK
ncbi:Helicase-like transcription factor [Lecanosticta acicola]|uniref:Helicase-like transcription factor n=1 Tax=Lecanosticta acicola TaxID=111012 RepID=A0AAI8Z1X0_9PEZI|nr:Helicase-like transcription factor [Lecanosticta acicola]